MLDPGALTTVQDRGRFGLAHLGVPRAGWLDDRAARLANRLVGNAEDAALLEVTFGGLSLSAGAALTIALTGADAPLTVAGRASPVAEAVSVPADAVVTIGQPRTGARSYLAFAGGVAVEPVLGSRSTDTLAFVGPPVVGAGDLLPIGQPAGTPGPEGGVAPPVPEGPARLGVRVGPRQDWFVPTALETLLRSTYTVGAASNRVGLRLDGPPLDRSRSGELPSEGIVLGAVQVPPSGRPLVFLNDHPTTGGYPVIGVVDVADLSRCAQLRPGDAVLFTRLPGR